MLLQKTDATFTNANLPVYSLSSTDKAIAALNPVVWMDYGSKFVKALDNINVDGWVNRSSGKFYIPTSTAKPQFISYGTNGNKIVRFGYVANATNSPLKGTSNCSLKAADNTDANFLSNTFTLAIVARQPIPYGTSGSDILDASVNPQFDAIFGSSAASNGQGIGLLVDQRSSGTGGAQYFTPNGTAPSSPNGTLDDGVFHTIMVSQDLATNTFKLYLDGTQVYSGPAIAYTADLSALTPMIGTWSLQGGFNFVGDIGHISYYKNMAAHLSSTNLSTINTKLNEVKSALV